ncbi:MAG: SPOR domain-containing protein [Bacteroidales bacterium]|nr:SPOR domain-containing protein [Candidatus Scybalousia scybalohippi]
MNVAEILYDYLKHNDVAEIPGLGTFYVKNCSARINDITGTIQPPSRKLTFEKKENGDMSFVSHMAQTEFMSMETTNTWIRQYAESVVDKVEKGMTVTIGKLGKISKGLVGEYTFSSEEGLNMLDDAFALGELKNVKVYQSEEKLDLIHTKPQEQVIEPEQVVLPTSMQQDKDDIEKKIEEAKQIKEEEKSHETQQETATRIIQHTEAVVDSKVTAPEAEQEVTETLDVDATPSVDKTQQTIDTAEQNTEKIVVEDIKPAAVPVEEDKETEEDDFDKTAKDIINRHSNTENAKPQKKKRGRKAWLIIFWIVLILILLCGGFVGAHWMGWLKDVKFLKPVTDKLAYYIPVRQVKEDAKTISATTVTNTQEPAISVEEVSATEESAPEIPYEAPAPVYTKEPVGKGNGTVATPKKTTTAKQTKKTNTKQETPAPRPAETVDNTPVLTQNYSKLGFDVVDGSYADKSRAEQQARKAKSLGYDSYVLSKIKSGSPIYYVSYGSRRTLSEANDLMQNMKTKMGGSYYVISR